MNNKPNETRVLTPWFFTPLLPPTRSKALAIGASYLLYAVVFLILYRILGGNTPNLGNLPLGNNPISGENLPALVIVPTAIVGWLLGWRMGVLGAFGSILLNMSLLFLVQFDQWYNEPIRALPGYVVIFVIALGAGLLHERMERSNELRRSLRQEKQTLQVEALERERAERELRRQNEYFIALQDTALGLVGRLDVGELLQVILARAGALVGTESGYVFLLDPETGKMTLRVGVGAYEQFVGTLATLGAGLAGRVWQTGEAIAVDDYRSWSERLADPSRNVLRAVIGVPLKRLLADKEGASEQVIGIIGLAHLEADKRFGPTEMDVLNRFASLASIVLDNARLYELAQHELAQRKGTEQFLDSIIENLPTMLFIKEAKELRFVRWNKAAETLSGRPSEEVLGKNDFDVVPADEAEFFVSKDRETLQSGQVVDILEEPFESSNGEKHWLHTKKFRVLDAEGKPAYLVGVAEDITERKRAEEESRQAREFLEAVVANIPMGIFAKDARDLRVVRWNKANEAISGRSADQVMGKTDYELFPEEQADFFVAKDRETLNGGQLLDIVEEPIQTPDRGLRYLHTKKIPLNDESGKPAYLLGISEDITDRKRTEDTLRQSEERYRDLFENANDLIQAVSADGHFMYVNRAWKEALGYSDEDLKELRFLDVLHPDARAKAVQATQRLLSGETVGEMNTEFLSKDGRKILVEGSATPRSENGKVISTRGIFRNVTDRRAAEQRAVIQNALLNAQYEVSPDGILVVGKDDRVLTYNRRYIEMWGFSKELMENGYAEDVRGEIRKLVVDEAEWLRRTGEIYMNQEASSRDEVRLKDDRIFERYSAPIKTPEGEYLGRVWFFHDITQTRRTEQDIQRIAETARVIFWHANVTDLHDESQEAHGYHWETEVSNFDALASQIPLKREPGYTDLDAWYQSWLDEDRAEMDRRSSQALRSGAENYQQEFRLRDANGDLHWMLEDAHVVRLTPDRYEVVGLTMDVTDRKRAEEAVRANQTLYQSLVETMPQALTRKDREGRVTFGNPRFFEDVNAKPEEILGKTDFDFHPRELAEKYWQDDLRVLRNGETIETIEPHQRGDGKQITVHVIKTPLRTDRNEIDGMQVMFWDITEEQARQEQIRQQNAYLNALQETSLGLLQRLDVNALLQDIVERAGALVGTESGYVFLRDSASDEMELRVGVGAYEGFVGRRTRPGVGLAGQVWETNAPVAVDDYRQWTGRLADASRDILRAVVGVPLRSGTDVVGVIGLAYLDETRKFGQAELQVLQRFAQLATIALDNARLYETSQQELQERSRAEVALAQQLRETEFVNRVTTHAVSLDVDKALFEICRDLAEYFEVEQSGIALLSEDRQSLTVVADHSPPGAPSVTGYVIPVAGNPSTEIVLQTRRPAAFSDALTDPRLEAIRELMTLRGTASILIAPLFVRDEIIGTLAIDSFRPREFTESDIALVQRVAVSISTALENARLYRSAQQEIADRRSAEQQMRQRNQELEVISRVSAVMTTNIDMITALETLARELVRTFRARNCGIALLNPKKDSLTVVADALAQDHEEHAVGIIIPLDGNPSSQYVIETKRSLVIADAQTDPMTEPIHERMRQRQTKCLAIIPLLSAGEVIGTIGLDTTDPDHIFSDEEIRLAETMANQMANAIEKQRLFDQTRERARREQMTRQIGANLTKSLDIETIMQTMARELSHALGASHAVVRMGATEQKENGGNGHT